MRRFVRVVRNVASRSGPVRPGSLLGLAAALACGGGCGEDRPAAAAAGHQHQHTSPHGGVLVELGEHQYQLDVRHDAARGLLEAWVLDGHAESFLRIAQTNLVLTLEPGGRPVAVPLRAQASAATGETLGDTSHFAGEAEALRGTAGLTGVVESVEVRGQVFRRVPVVVPASQRP